MFCLTNSFYTDKTRFGTYFTYRLYYSAPIYANEFQPSLSYRRNDLTQLKDSKATKMTIQTEKQANYRSLTDWQELAAVIHRLFSALR